MEQKELNRILKLHKLWFECNKDGVRANLSGANLRGVNLSGANLRYVNLRGVNLRDANLRDANLRGVNLYDANLYGVNLRYAGLSGVNLRDANLRGVNLRDADLCVADLRDANLRGADLRDANLRGADLSGANLTDTRLPHFQIPQGVSLTVYKKLRDGVVAKLLIEDGVKRTASLVGSKCRAEKALVVDLLDSSGEKLRIQTGFSKYDRATTYKVGEYVYPDKYDDDIRVECTHGIHFFMTFKEAAVY